MATDNNTPTIDDAQVVEWVEQPLLQLAKVTSDGRILKGLDAEDAPFGSIETWLLCLHSVDLPIPSNESSVIAQSCVRNVPHPLLGSVKQFAVSMDAALVMLEVAHALKKRDDRISELKGRVETLESDLEMMVDNHGSRLDEVESLMAVVREKQAADQDAASKAFAALQKAGLAPLPGPETPVPAAVPVRSADSEPEENTEA